MTEEEWLECTDAEIMLAALPREPLERKLRLFACACVRTDWHVSGFYSDKVIRVAERMCDGDASAEDCATASELVEVAFAHVGLDWSKHVIVDPTLTRPAEVDFLVGDASKARRELGWRPEVTFKELIERMVDADLNLNRRRDG